MKALELLRAIGCLDASPVTFEIPGNPAVKSLRSMAAHMESVIDLWKHALSGRTMPSGVAVSLVFYRKTFQRIDVDNMTKFVMDSGTRSGAWDDDSQVTASSARVEMDRDNPRTEVAIGEIATSMDRALTKTGQCLTCSAIFEGDPRTSTRGWKFCSSSCAQSFQLRKVRCATCDKIFQRSFAGQRICEQACRDAAAGVVRERRLRAKSRCIKCGALVSRREYLQCWLCTEMGRPKWSRDKERRISKLSVRALRRASPDAEVRAAGDRVLKGTGPSIELAKAKEICVQAWKSKTVFGKKWTWPVVSQQT